MCTLSPQLGIASEKKRANLVKYNKQCIFSYDLIAYYLSIKLLSQVSESTMYFLQKLLSSSRCLRIVPIQRHFYVLVRRHYVPIQRQYVLVRRQMR